MDALGAAGALYLLAAAGVALVATLGPTVLIRAHSWPLGAALGATAGVALRLSRAPRVALLVALGALALLVLPL